MKFLILISVIMMSQLSFASNQSVLGVATAACSKGYLFSSCGGKGFIMKQRIKKEAVNMARRVAEDKCISQGLYPDEVYKKEANCKEVKAYMSYEFFCNARVIMSCI